MNKRISGWAALLLALALVGCNEQKLPMEGDSLVGDGVQYNAVESGGIMLNGDSASSEAAGVIIEGTTVTITEGGSYTLAGKLEEASVVIEVNKSQDVTLILSNAELSASHTAVILVKSAGNVTLIAADGTVNSVTESAKSAAGVVTFLEADGKKETADAAIFSKDDLKLEGGGELHVTAAYGCGISSSNDIDIRDITLNVKAADHGIKGKDSVEIKGGMLHVEAVGDGVKSTEDAEAGKGFVEISGGKLNIIAADDALSAVTEIRITGGEIGIETENNALKCDGSIAVTGGTLDIVTEDDDFKCDIVEGSADAKVTVNGETFTF